MSLENQFIDSLRKWTSGDLKDDLHRKGLPNKGNKTDMVLRLQEFYRQQLMTPNVSTFTEPSNRQTTTTHTYVQTDRSDPAVGQPSRDHTAFTPIQPLQQQQNAHSLSDPNIYTSQRRHASSQFPAHSLLPNVSTTPTTSTYTISHPTLQSYQNTGAHLSHSFSHSPTMTTSNTVLGHVSTGIQITNSNTAQHSELQRLQLELSILKTREEIRNTQYRLSQPPSNTITTAQSDLNSSILQLVKKSVDISSLPPAKPTIFSGNIIEYPKWKSMFDLLVESKDLHPSQKLIYLEDFLSGEALDCIRGLNTLNTSDAYYEARRILDERFGDSYDIADAYREQLEFWPKISAGDNKGLQKYADFLRQCIIAMNSITELSKLSDPRIMKCFPNALPDSVMDKWCRIAGKHKLENKQHLSFEKYVEFVKKEAYLANDTTTSTTAIKAAKQAKTQGKHTITHTSNTDKLESPQLHSLPPSPNTTRRRPLTLLCHHCQTFAKHNTADCENVTSLNTYELESLIERENLCSKCLRRGHNSESCYTKVSCKSCGGSHATYLHDKQHD